MAAPDDQNNADDPEEDGRPDPDLKQSGPRLMRVFFIVAAINLSGLVWLGLRANSPASLRGSLDVLFQLAVGGGIAFAAFRSLIAYPFHMTDLFAMVLVLGGWLRLSIDAVHSMSNIGLIRRLNAEGEFGQILLVGLLSTSVLVAGGALGLWSCQKLKIQNAASRLFTLIPAMLVLPAAAGCAAFALVALEEFAQKNGSNQQATLWMLCWFACVIITFINTATFIRTTALNVELKENEAQK